MVTNQNQKVLLQSPLKQREVIETTSRTTNHIWRSYALTKEEDQLVPASKHQESKNKKRSSGSGSNGLDIFSLHVPICLSSIAYVFCWTNLIATAIFAAVSRVLRLILILSMQLLCLYLDILSIIGYDIDRLI